MDAMRTVQRVEAGPYADNFEHLADLEREAILRVAVAHFRRKAENPDLVAAGAPFPDGESALTDTLLLPGIGIRVSSIGECREQLDRLDTARMLRESASTRAGITLGFNAICAEYGLTDLERQILVLLYAVGNSERFRRFQKVTVFRETESWSSEEMSIRSLLAIVSGSLREEVENRLLFSVDSVLIRQELAIVRPARDCWSPMSDQLVHLHGHFARLVMGDRGIYYPTFKGVRRETPRISAERVILPGKLKEELLTLARNFSNGSASRIAPAIGDFYGYGAGMTFLFYGPSGTGKTMMAHAIAHSVGRDLFTLNMARADDEFGPDIEELIRYTFREARLSNGVVFFDECDDLFAEGSWYSRALLIELEKANVITIMATNKPGSLDPALERRLTRIEDFPFPDVRQRARLWKALLPPNVAFEEGLDVGSLAREFALAGGHIKNAILTAIHDSCNSAECASNTIVLSGDALRQAAARQIQQSLEDETPGDSYPPIRSAEDFPIRPKSRKILSGLAGAARTARENGMGLNLFVISGDLDTGAAAMDSIAMECGLWVRRADLEPILLPSMDVNDGFRVRRIKPIDYIFSPANEKKAVTVMVDRGDTFASRSAGKPGEEKHDSYLEGFLSRLSRSRGIHAVVVRSRPKMAIPEEFHYILELDRPTEADQIARWKRYLEANGAGLEKIVDIVEQHPMHLREIDAVARQAALIALVEEGLDHPGTRHVEEAIRRHRMESPARVLFGKR